MGVKLSLSAAPTFKASVGIPVPGAARPVQVQFVFKHRDRPALRDFAETLSQERDEADLVEDMACGWDLDDPFGRENIERLVTSYPGSALAILEVYMKEASGTAHRAKN